LLIWLSLWFAAQFIFHWLRTIMGNGQGVIRYFRGSVKLIQLEGVYIPYLYHIVLHLLIISALTCTAIYTVKSVKE
jgi:hypothetical protein